MKIAADSRLKPELQKAIADGTIPASYAISFLKLDKKRDRAVYDRLIKAAIAKRLPLTLINVVIAGYLEKLPVEEKPKKEVPPKKKFNVVLLDYADTAITSQMSPVKIKAAIKLLVHYSKELEFSSKLTDFRYYRGVLDGIELMWGLRIPPIK